MTHIERVNEIRAKFGFPPVYPKGLGDQIASLAEPIAKALKLPCIDPATGKTKPESGCGKMKARLNAGMPVAEAMKLRFQGK